MQRWLSCNWQGGSKTRWERLKGSAVVYTQFLQETQLKMAALLSCRAENEVQFILESCPTPCVAVTVISSRQVSRGSPQNGHARAAVPLRVIKCISCLLEGGCWCESRRSSGTAKCTLISSCSQEGQSHWKTQRGVPRLN